LTSAQVGDKPTRSIQYPVYDPLAFTADDIFADRYRIMSEIGRGGMGRVFRARDLELDIEIAIKVIRPEFLDDERMVKRFKNEILLAREVSHENVVRIHDFSEWHGIKYITMQYIEGQTLRQLLNQSGPLDVQVTEKLVTQICHGLEAARKKGIAHRDLKPQNILVDRSGQAYIADFGLARSSSQSGVSVPGVILGTPEYISPEQWRGERGDFRSDIYSLGIMLYEMVTARPLFQSDTELGFLQKHLHEMPHFAADDKRNLPDYLRRIILRCLAKDPEARYQSVSDIESDIMAHRATVMPLRYRAVYWTRKGALLLASVLVLTLAAWGLLRRQETAESDFAKETKRSLIVLPFANNTGEERYAFWSKGLADLLSTDLGQSRFIYVAGASMLQTFLNRYPDWTPDQSLSHPQLEVLHVETAADYALLGELNQAGNRFRLSARIISLKNGEIHASFQSDGLGEDSLFAMINSITDKTKLAFNLSREMILQDLDKDVRQISTHSVEALKAYSSAKEFFHLGKFRDSVAEYEKAIAADPDFAMAYAGAANAMIGDNDSRCQQFFERALTLSERVSRRERLHIEGRYLFSFKVDYQNALARFQELLKQYPDDQDALLSIAAINRNMENWTQAKRVYLELEKLSPGRAIISANLFSNELEQGHFSAARDILERYKNELQKTQRYHYFQFYIYYQQGLLDQAEEELNMARSESGVLSHYNIMMGNLMMLRNQLDKAAEFYHLAWDNLSSPQKKVRIIDNLSSFSLLQGHLKAALSRIDGLRREFLADDDSRFTYEMKSTSLNILAGHPDKSLQSEALTSIQALLAEEPKNQVLPLRFSNLYTFGRLLIIDENWQKLAEVLADMDQLVASLGAPKARFPLHLRSLAALARRELTEAENFYYQALKLFPDPLRPIQIADFNQTLARIKAAAGEYEEAMALYQSIISRQLGLLENGAAYVMAHVELARLQQKSGRLSWAKETATKVIDWWQGGDYAPEIVEEMKKIVTGD